MARLFDAALSEYIDCGAGPVTGVPFTLACFMYMDDITSTGGNSWLSLSHDTTANNFALLAFNDATDDVVFSVRAGVDGTQTASAGGTILLNQWHHVAAVAASATSRIAYFDGVGGTASTQSRSPSINTALIGAWNNASTIQNHHRGGIAEVGIWNVGLTAEEIAALSAGAPPWTIRPGALVSYWPLMGDGSPEPDPVGGFNGTLNGTVKTEHRPIIYPGALAIGAAAAAGGGGLSIPIAMSHYMRLSQ